MQLYIGGYAQGKLAYVQEKLKGQKVPVVNDLHLWVKGKPGPGAVHAVCANALLRFSRTSASALKPR